jgi:phospholipid N-methyltransferase
MKLLAIPAYTEYTEHYTERKKNNMINELSTAYMDYHEETMDGTVSEIINILSERNFTISDTLAIFQQVLNKLINKMKINTTGLE